MAEAPSSPSSASSSGLATASGARTVREVDERPVEDGVLHLIVMGANIFSMHPLPDSGVVSIGHSGSASRHDTGSQHRPGGIAACAQNANGRAQSASAQSIATV